MSEQSTFLVYNELRLLGRFCDAVIKVEDVKFRIHKIILCNSSPFFRALFERWSTTDRRVFNIPSLSPDIMNLILEFAYTGSVSVTGDNVQALTLAADMLRVTGLMHICFDFLSEQLCSQNCVGVWKLTKVCHSSKLQDEAFRHITDHFEEVVRCEEFLQFSVKELSEILGRDDLNVRYENTVYESVLRWIAHVPEKREKHIAVLLSKVRLALTSIEYIRISVLSNKLVKNNNECLQMVHNAIQILHYRFTSLPRVFSFSNSLARPRLPHAILLAIGGWNENAPTNSIEAYDFRTNNWVNVANNMERARAYHGTAFLNGHVYWVGGYDGEEHFSSMYRFDLSSRTWHEAAPMHHCRSYVSVTVLDGYIYAIGGFNSYERQNSAERYRPKMNQWSLIAPMHEKRSNTNCTALYGKVYICGGFNGFQCLQTAEYYDPETNHWTMITPMSNWRSGSGVIAYADRIFVVGGFDGNRLSTVESFDPLTDTWEAEPPMINARSNFGIAVLDGRLFVVGGYNGFNTDCAVEYYDTTTNEWAEACDMQSSCCALSCCVVSGLLNMAEYAFPRDYLPLVHLDKDEAPIRYYPLQKDLILTK